MHKVPVYNSNGEYLSDANSSRINKWLESGKAVKYRVNNIFSVKLTTPTLTPIAQTLTIALPQTVGETEVYKRYMPLEAEDLPNVEFETLRIFQEPELARNFLRSALDNIYLPEETKEEVEILLLDMNEELEGLYNIMNEISDARAIEMNLYATFYYFYYQVALEMGLEDKLSEDVKMFFHPGSYYIMKYDYTKRKLK